MTASPSPCRGRRTPTVEITPAEVVSLLVGDFALGRCQRVGLSSPSRFGVCGIWIQLKSTMSRLAQRLVAHDQRRAARPVGLGHAPRRRGEHAQFDP